MEYMGMVLNFKEKIGMIGVGEWQCVDLSESKKYGNQCRMSEYKKDLKVIGILNEEDLIQAIEDGKVEIGKKSKFIFKKEKVKA